MECSLPHSLCLCLPSCIHSMSSDDEMCIVYLFVEMDRDSPLVNRPCRSPGPPDYSWSRDPGLWPEPSTADKIRLLPVD